MPSLHKQMIRKNMNLNRFKVVAKSDDDIIESIEHKDSRFIIGVQFHPKLEKDNLKIFEAFLNSIEDKICEE